MARHILRLRCSFIRHDTDMHCGTRYKKSKAHLGELLNSCRRIFRDQRAKPPSKDAARDPAEASTLSE
jgi:hypothetical protein